MSNTPSSDGADREVPGQADAHQVPGNDPGNTPGLDSGGGVEPGDTPPDSGVGMDHGGTPAHHGKPEKPSSKAPVYIIGAVVLFALLLVFVGYIAGIIG